MRMVLQVSAELLERRRPQHRDRRRQVELVHQLDQRARDGTEAHIAGVWPGGDEQDVHTVARPARVELCGIRHPVDPALDLVIAEKDAARQTRCFENFVEFFEAILAYHKAHGGN